MKRVLYLRTSTPKQTIGIQVQRKKIQEWLDEDGLLDTVVNEFVEHASAKDERHRPVLMQAIQYCKDNKCTLIVSTFDRLSRNCHDGLSFHLRHGISWEVADSSQFSACFAMQMNITTIQQAKEYSEQVLNFLSQCPP